MKGYPFPSGHRDSTSPGWEYHRSSTEEGDTVKIPQCNKHAMPGSRRSTCKGKKLLITQNAWFWFGLF